MPDEDKENMEHLLPNFRYDQLRGNYRGSIGVEKGWLDNTFYELLESKGEYPEKYIIGELTSLNRNGLKKEDGKVITKEVTPEVFKKMQIEFENMQRECDQMTRLTEGGKKRKSRKQKKSLKRKSRKARKSHKKRR